MSSTIIYKSPLCSCIFCNKQFSAKGINSHYLCNHSTLENKERMQKGFKIGGQIANSNSKNRATNKKNEQEIKYNKNPNKCVYCNSILTFEKKDNKVCSKSCSGKYSNNKRLNSGWRLSKKSKQKISNSLKGKKYNHGPRLYLGPYTKLSGYFICTCCNKSFWSITGRRTCSPECQRKNSTYRKIIYHYNNNGEDILLESSWEVEIAKWLDILNITWIRPNHLIWFDDKNKKHRYFADFYLPKFNIYLDPKNEYQIKISEQKLNYISSRVTLIYGTVDYIKTELLKIIKN